MMNTLTALLEVTAHSTDYNNNNKTTGLMIIIVFVPLSLSHRLLDHQQQSAFTGEYQLLSTET